MGKLIIIAEKGVPHTAVKVQISDNAPQWYGFRPQKRFRAIGKGLVDTSNREEYARKSVHFNIPDKILVQAVANVLAKYQNALYILFFRDCVDFVTDLAEEVGLLSSIDKPFGTYLGFSPKRVVHNLSKIKLQSHNSHFVN